LLLPPAPPLQNLIFRFLQSRQKIQIWLFEQTDLRIEGRIIVSGAPARRRSSAAASSVAVCCLPLPAAAPSIVQRNMSHSSVVCRVLMST
jgi:hypothetical protein